MNAQGQMLPFDVDLCPRGERYRCFAQAAEARVEALTKILADAAARVIPTMTIMVQASALTQPAPRMMYPGLIPRDLRQHPPED